jgi:hypothetical protein
VKRRTKFALASVLLSLSFPTLGVLWADPAAAAGTCSGTNTNFFDGYYQIDHPEHPYEGASTFIVVRDGAVCSGVVDSNNFLGGWVMIASGTQGQGYGQVGFDRYAGTTLKWFAEFNDGLGHVADRFSTFSVTNQVGVQHTFRVLWTPACACLHANIDTTNWLNSTFNPFFVGWGPQPWSPQFMDEATWLQTDVPGTPSARTSFSGMGAQRLSDDIIESMPCILSSLNSSSRWSHSASSCTAVTLWTNTP